MIKYNNTLLKIALLASASKTFFCLNNYILFQDKKELQNVFE